MCMGVCGCVRVYVCLYTFVCTRVRAYVMCIRMNVCVNGKKQRMVATTNTSTVCKLLLNQRRKSEHNCKDCP